MRAAAVPRVVPRRVVADERIDGLQALVERTRVRDTKRETVGGAATVERAVQMAGTLGLPLVGELDTSGAELRDGVAALHAWGRLARLLVGISGQVPTLAVVTGACVSGPALALGLFDHVVMTEDAFAYVTGS